MDDRHLLDDSACGGDPPCWMHEFEDELGLGSGVPAVGVDLAALAEAGGRGPVWSNRGADLDVNLLVFEEGDGVAEHVNEQVDVLLVAVAGKGAVTIQGQPREIVAGQAVLIPKGARRGIRALDGRFAYLTCHRRRAGLMPTVSAAAETDRPPRTAERS